MPSAQDISTSQFDEDGVPIAIGFQTAKDNQAEGQSDFVDPKRLNPVGSQSKAADEAMEPQETLAGYELVTDMLRRQDEALKQLDDLNARIELAIEEISAARKIEIQALEAQGQLLDDDDQAMDQQKAA